MRDCSRMMTTMTREAKQYCAVRLCTKRKKGLKGG